MKAGNNHQGYGVVSIILHWTVAIVIVGLFSLGLWMTSLTYYDTWYHKGPELHKGIGILLTGLMTLRLVWRMINPKPAPVEGSSTFEITSAHFVHLGLYALFFGIAVTGYLISTAEGKPINVFDWFSIPATIAGGKSQADLAGEIHLVLAITLITLASLHALAALKHHFLNRDATLRRMIKPTTNA